MKISICDRCKNIIQDHSVLRSANRFSLGDGIQAEITLELYHVPIRNEPLELCGACFNQLAKKVGFTPERKDHA